MWGAYCFNTGEPVADQVDEFFKVADPDDQTLMALDFNFAPDIGQLKQDWTAA